MKKFNTSDIFTGYLKQLLKTFNLPKLKVYTKEHEEFFKKENKERSDILNTITKDTKLVDGKDVKYFPNDTHYVPYIKDGKIQEYIDKKWVLIGGHSKNVSPKYYTYGDKVLNYTKNLVIKNNIYDSYTHEYLGDYLRFQRDYNGLNLMSLYNCFSNRACDSLNIRETLNLRIPETDTIIKTDIVFDTSDTNFKIYMLPVKLFQKYTIAIDCNTPFELCCGIYGDYQDNREKFKPLTALTYQKINQSSFSRPFLFNKIDLETLSNWGQTRDILKKEIIKNESDLKLFIKLPNDNTSTIVVLEGNYINWNNTNFKKDPAASVEYTAIYPSLEELESNCGFHNNLYLVKASDNNYGVYWCAEGASAPVNLGSIWGEKLNYLNDINQFEVIEDTTDAPTVEEAFNNYKSSHSLTTPYVIYIHTTKKDIYIPPTTWFKTTNHSVLNLEATSNGVTDANDISLISPLQLLQFNTKEQHPFADRLIEYLTNNAIVGTDEEISANIKRAQKALRYKDGTNVNKLTYIPKTRGIWDHRMNKLFYKYMIDHQNTTGINRDILGYVDKDVEKYYTCVDPTTNQKVSLLNIELTKEEK